MATTTKPMERQVEIPSGRRKLSGILRVPAGARGIVAFAHGSGSGRFSPRNQFVARVLEKGGLATLLLDLLEEEEAEDREKVFDIELLAERLQSAADWLSQEPQTHALRLGYFGASTGAGAALVAAARNPAAVAAVVSRGGAPGLGPCVSFRRPGADLVDRWRQRRRGDRVERTRSSPVALLQAVSHRPWRDAPVRGAGYVGGGCSPGEGMVHSLSPLRG